MARIFYRESTGELYGVHPGAFAGKLPEGILFIDVAEDSDNVVWPDASGERGAKVVDGVLVPNRAFVPVAVTKLQLVRAMRAAGKWTTVRAGLNQVDALLKEDWDLASDVHRDDSVIAVLDLTPVEVDDLFIVGVTL